MATPENRRRIGSRHVKSGSPAADIASSDLINIFDTVDVPIAVLRPDFTLVWFNKAANVLGFSPSDIGRTSRDLSALAGVPRLEEQCSRVIATGIESRTDFRHERKLFVIRISTYTRDDGQVSGIYVMIMLGAAWIGLDRTGVRG